MFYGRKGGDIMVIKKDIIIAVLATFCLTATLFTIVPARSSPNGYDPWIDLDDDGKIGPYDFYLFSRAYGSTGTPTNKTALLLELQSRIDSLNASLIALQKDMAILETWMPKKGHIIVSPIALLPGNDLESYSKNEAFIYGGGLFYAALELPNGATIKNMTALLYDGLAGDYQIKIDLLRYSLDGHINLMASILYYGTGAPGLVYQHDDTISNSTVDNQNYMYILEVWFELEHYNLQVYWVTLDYEY